MAKRGYLWFVSAPAWRFNCDSRFTWALRTIAFLEQKLLKDNTTAEAVLIEACLRHRPTYD